MADDGDGTQNFDHLQGPADPSPGRSRRSSSQGPKKVKPFKLVAWEPTEAELHKSVSEMLDRMLLPPAVWTTFPAGWGNLPKATCGRLYACGLKAGMPDILVFFNGFTLGIELKVPGRSPSSKQRSMFSKLQAAGVPVMICHSMEEVYDALEYRCFPLRRAFKWNTSSA